MLHPIVEMLDLNAQFIATVPLLLAMQTCDAASVTPAYHNWPTDIYGHPVNLPLCRALRLQLRQRVVPGTSKRDGWRFS